MNGRLDEAIEHDHKVLQAESLGAEVYLNLGNAFAKANRLSEAVEHYEKSLRAKFDNAPALWLPFGAFRTIALFGMMPAMLKKILGSSPVFLR